jgi:hypothetical protein
VPPPATISGRRAERRAAAAPASTSGSAGRAAHVPDAALEERLRPVVGLGLHVLRQRQRDGAGLHRVGEHAHRRERARDELLGRLMRSKKRDTGRKASLTETSSERGSSSSCSTGLADARGEDVAGSSSTGRRLIVASAAPVTMFVAPGPIDDVHASVDSRLRMRA